MSKQNERDQWGGRLVGYTARKKGVKLQIIEVEEIRADTWSSRRSKKSREIIARVKDRVRAKAHRRLEKYIIGGILSDNKITEKQGYIGSRSGPRSWRVQLTIR